MKKSRWSQSNPIPLLTKRPAGEEEEEPSCHSKRELQLVTTSPFRLPDGWYVEEKRRPLSNTSHPGKIDRYYIEPGTGLKFRSLSAVQRYLTEGKIETRTKNSEPGNEWNKQIAPRTTWSTSSFVLPDGWEVEEKQRNNSHIIDKTYIEPGTGQRFRSLISVERYLTGANEDTPLKALIPANKSGLSPGSGRQKMKSLGEIQSQKVVSSSLTRNISGVNDRPSKLNFGRPPAKVKWVLGGPGGCMWNPFMDESKMQAHPKFCQILPSSQVPLYLWGGSLVHSKRFVANLHRVTTEAQFQKWRAAYASAIPDDVQVKLVKYRADDTPRVDANDPNARIITFRPFYFSLGFTFPLSRLFKDVFCAMECAPSQCTPKRLRY